MKSKRVGRERRDGGSQGRDGLVNNVVLRNKREWDDLAVLDPLWSILSDPTKRFAKWDVEDFFSTGRREIEEMLVEARALGYPPRGCKALDFGCGVGRVTRALAEHFSECYGVDISEEMIKLARQFNRHIGKRRFIVNTAGDLKAFPGNHFDMVYSNIVLQHLPDRNQIRSYVSEFIRIVAPGGLVVFQLASWIPWRNRIQIRRRLYSLLRNLGADGGFLYTKLGLHPIRMNFIPEREVINLLEAAGARVLDVRRRARSGRSFQSCLYFVSK